MASTGSMGTLSWSAKLDSNEFKKGVRKVKKEMKEAQKAVGESLKVMAKGFAVVTGAVTGATVALGAMVKQSADVVNSQKILADSIGATQQEIAGLELASDSMGVSYDQLIDKMREIGGIEEFEKLADDVASASSATESMKIAQEALGNEGLKLLPILQQGSAGLRAYSQEALKLGLALPEDKVNALTSAWGAFEKAMQMVRGLTRQLSAELGESFGRTFTLIQAIVETFRDNFVTLFGDINKSYSSFINILVKGVNDYGIPAWVGFQNAVADVGEAVAYLFNLFASSPIGTKIDNWTLSLFDFMSAMKEVSRLLFIDLVLGFINIVGDAMVGTLSWLNDLNAKIQDILVDLGIKDRVQVIGEKIVDAVRLEALKKGLDNVKEVVGGIKKVFEEDLENALGERIKQVEDMQNKFKFNVDKAEATRLKAFNGGDEDGKTDPVKVELDSGGVSQNNVLATAGSVEEFNLMKSQRKEELNILKKIAENTSKTAKNQTQDAGFNG